MRKVFLDNLPKRGKFINWEKSIGYKVKFIYDEIQGEVEIVNYNNLYIFINYINNENYKIAISSFSKCSLGAMLKIRTSEFRVEIGTQFKDDKRNLIILDRKYKKYINMNKKIYKYKCNKCGWDEGWIEEKDLLMGNGCSCCCPTPRVVVPGINDIPTTAPWMVKYFQGGYDEAKLYTKSSNKKIYPICPDCGTIKNRSITINNIYYKKTIGCSCGDNMSFPNKFMFSILKQLKIDFINEFTPIWCKYKINNKIKTGRYDFYFKLDNKEYIIEMDGFFHKNNNNISGQTKEESEQIDYEKDRLAKEHNIEVIRIDCDRGRYDNLEFIKNNILKSRLLNLLNLNLINWNKCEEFSLNNLCKETCELKRNNPKMTTTDICKIMQLCRHTICSYLNKGTKLGWCNYNPKEEVKIINSKNGKIFRKPVEIFKDGKSLGKFESCSELSRRSEKLFGTKLFQNYMSQICNKEKTYKGYMLKYINNVS